jgi:hypothetical protein
MGATMSQKQTERYQRGQRIARTLTDDVLSAMRRYRPFGDPHPVLLRKGLVRWAEEDAGDVGDGLDVDTELTPKGEALACYLREQR